MKTSIWGKIKKGKGGKKGRNGERRMGEGAELMREELHRGKKLKVKGRRKR